jgi:transcription antitermination protein NusB
LYHYLLLLILDIKGFAEEKIELGKNKFRPSDAELNPITRFVNNKVIIQLESNKQLKKFLNDYKFSWVNYPELIKKTFTRISESKEYNSYINGKEPGYKDDKQIIIDIFTNHIAESEELFSSLEEQSIYWNDDVEFIISMINKTIGSFKEDQNDTLPLASLYKSKDDIGFVQTLFRKSIMNHEDNQALIGKYTKNWEIERIAYMDTLLMEMAIVEAIEMDYIPVRVTLNEYIEISKFYSTEKSSVFINGILDKIFSQLKADNKIIKKGRGLVGENAV